jgi:hypothetical protein
MPISICKVFVNKQNYRYWSETNPRQLHERPLHSPKVSVWCGVGSIGVIGPYFFEDADGRATTVNAQLYTEMMTTFVVLELHQRCLEANWFQQDGATARTARHSMETLCRLFPNRITSRFGDVSWPPRSPDLSAPDFFLLGCLKDKVFTHPLHTIEELKACIRHEVEAITPDLLRRVMGNCTLRLQQCIAREGAHLDDLIFKK